MRLLNVEGARTGVYICHCGTNIAGVIDVGGVVRFASKLPSVIFAMDDKYLCSETGQAMIRDNINKYNINRVVIGACSPRMHEQTFKKAVEAAGLNPYLLEIANIREQCSWVHLHEPEEATKKAEALISAAVAKARLLEPLTPMKFKITPAALVIGGGIAGIQAALDLANMGFKVYLVEKTPSIGGHMAQLDKTFPTLDCSTCILGPKMVDVAQHPNVVLLTYSEVVGVEGYIGNFRVTVARRPRYVIEKECNGCGECAKVCPVEVPNEFDMGLGYRKAIYMPFPQAVPAKYTIDRKSCIECMKCVEACKLQGRNAINLEMKEEEIKIEVGTIIIATGYDLYDARELAEYGYGRYEDVITNLEFERMVNAAGPSGGRIIRPSDGKEPKRVGFIQCVGSRDFRTGITYCSRICCMASIKHAYQVKEKIPEAEVYIFYMDLRTFGKGCEEFLERVQRGGVIFVRGRTEIYGKPEAKSLVVRFEDTFLGKVMEMEFDLIVLAAGLVSRIDSEDVQRILKLSRSPDNFFLEAHPKLRPVETHSLGIYLCGCAQGPKDIPDTVAQASAAAAQAAIPLLAGEVTAEPTVAYVDEEICGGCRICESACPYGAVRVEETDRGRRAEVNEALCRGCGTCGAACPSGAITMRGFTKEQILAQVEALLMT
ncbi:CoB--CoM heterodisulfide reductase iron-sulfur subunit A family protein [Candidatus Bathyarchaeota archaeon]|nr:CoB--CoM heterodisulfide reductase iron-sulfur subunit A family protein [Candidatus Bathyarchaeota archaeon]